MRTRGFCDLIDITPDLQQFVADLPHPAGAVAIFVPGATAGVTTIEYESGAVQDFQETMDRLVPPSDDYAHNARWGDGNGFSHVRSALVGPSVLVPFEDHRPSLGTWQQVVVVDFDNRPRKRTVLLSALRGLDS